ncbi:hypothetical protein EJB05_45651 [Eragrostis curvula]|uniref:RRM domain-containing protein n=1 Tax=Eragrostis curvula TaxID=38414 RepID=A0A5J9SCY8_9POAL|nr:hypothetical protein EJB05_57605 [Eragrostis curvula]TVU12031.1 hypothetical protein EJB05_45651 [Eragrostis curvula]
MAAPSPSSTSASPGGGPRPYRSRFGDTTLTKVFVGGLAWETPSEGLRQHFERYGDILEAVVITDRLTGRSKGYGFVTFREAEAAQRAVQDPNPVIAGRRANCNIASLGPPRPAQPRGRASLGPHLQVPPPVAQGPQFFPRAPPQMIAQHGGPAAIYPPQFGYWYPPDFQYQQIFTFYDPHSSSLQQRNCLGQSSSDAELLRSALRDGFAVSSTLPAVHGVHAVSSFNAEGSSRSTPAGAGTAGRSAGLGSSSDDAADSGFFLARAFVSSGLQAAVAFSCCVNTASQRNSQLIRPPLQLERQAQTILQAPEQGGQN